MAIQNSIDEFYNTLKLLKNLFRLRGIFLPNLRILSRKNNKLTLFILLRAMTVITSIIIGQTKRQFGIRLKEHQKAVFFCKKENSALSEHTCVTNHKIGWDKSKVFTTNRRYHQRLCLEAWHINSTLAPLNRYDGGLLPNAYLRLVRNKRS